MSPDLSASLVPCWREGQTLPVGLLLLHATTLLVDEQLAGRPAPRQPLAVCHRFVLGLVHAGGPARPLGLDLPPTGWTGHHVVGRPFAHPPRGSTLCLEGLVPLHPPGRLAYPAERLIGCLLRAAALVHAHILAPPLLVFRPPAWR